MDNIIFIGCGTSFHACMIARNLSKKYCKFKQISIYDGADFDEKDIPIYGNNVIVFTSQSGETRDLYPSYTRKRENIPQLVLLMLTCLTAREVDCGTYCNEREVES